MCNNDNSRECGGGCIAEILEVINILQNNAECAETCLETCDRGFLGCGTTSLGCNTRPIMLYTNCGNGTPWSMPTAKTTANCEGQGITGTCSDVFRIEKIDGCCATFRVLAPNPEISEGVVPYVSTNSFFTMNLNCCCCIRCLQDTFVECI